MQAHARAVAIKIDQAALRIRRMRDRFDALSNRIAEAYGQLPLEEGLAEIDTLVAQNRAS